MTVAHEILLERINIRGFGKITIKVINGVPYFENGCLWCPLRMDKNGNIIESVWITHSGKQPKPNFSKRQLELIDELWIYQTPHIVTIKFKHGQPFEVEAKRSLGSSKLS